MEEFVLWKRVQGSSEENEMEDAREVVEIFHEIQEAGGSDKSTSRGLILRRMVASSETQVKEERIGKDRGWESLNRREVFF